MTQEEKQKIMYGFYKYWEEKSQHLEQRYLTPDTRSIINDYWLSLLDKAIKDKLEAVEGDLEKEIEFPNENNWNYQFYKTLDDMVIDGSGYNMQQFIDLKDKHTKDLIDAVIEDEEKKLRKIPEIGPRDNMYMDIAWNYAKQDTISKLKAIKELL
jgi:hypothetical protein